MHKITPRYIASSGQSCPIQAAAAYTKAVDRHSLTSRGISADDVNLPLALAGRELSQRVWQGSHKIPCILLGIVALHVRNGLPTDGVKLRIDGHKFEVRSERKTGTTRSVLAVVWEEALPPAEGVVKCSSQSHSAWNCRGDFSDFTVVPRTLHTLLDRNGNSQIQATTNRRLLVTRTNLACGPEARNRASALY